MQMRGLVVRSLLVFGGLGLFRGAAHATLTHASVAHAVPMYASALALSLIWVLPVVAVYQTWERGWSWRQLIACHAAIGLAMLVLEPFWIAIVSPGFPHLIAGWPQRIINRFDLNSLVYVCIVGATWAMAERRRELASELSAAVLGRRLADAQLHVLTLQLHPHFLFNTLNLISQLAYESVADALRTLGNLRALLVQSLDHAGRREVSLRDELGFLTAYVDIQQSRFRDRLDVSLDVDPDAVSAAVPHLLLQPLVENAIVHAIGPRAARGVIRVVARRQGNRLHITIHDDGTNLSLPVREGLGLSNTRLRLEQLFDSNYRFTIEREVNGGALVTIDIPFRCAVEPSSDVVWNDGAELAETTPDERTVAPRAPRARRLPAFVQLVIGWAVVAVFWTELESLWTPAEQGPAFHWGSSAASSSLNSLVWIVLTPLVVWIARRIDLGRRASGALVAAHAGMGVVIALTHVTVWLLILHRFLPEQYDIHLRQSLDWLLWDYVAYTAIVAFATVASLGARHRDVRLAIARDRTRLSRARIASLRLRLQPGILLSGLDAIAEAIAHDAARSEPAIARMGDLLRGLLASAESEYLTIAEELALLQSYLDVLGATRGGHAAVFDVQFPWSAAESAHVPALVTVSLAAIVTGRISQAELSSGDGALLVRLHCVDGVLDRARLADLDARLRVISPGHYRLDVRAAAHGMALELRLPLRSMPESDAADALGTERLSA